MLHGGFALFNTADVGIGRSLMKVASHFVELVGSTGGVDVNPPVIQISGPAIYADEGGILANEMAESDALHVSGNEPFASLLQVIVS